MMLAHIRDAGIDRAQLAIDQLHEGVAAAMRQITNDRAEIMRLQREIVDLEQLAAANQEAATMMEASLQVAGFFLVDEQPAELVMARDASLFAKMAAIGRGYQLRLVPRVGSRA